MKSTHKQRGFTAVEGIVVAAVVFVVVFGGWLVLRDATKKSGSTPGAKTSQGSSKAQATSDPKNFTAASATVKLLAWKVQMTLPASSIGKAVYKYDSTQPAFIFSTKAITSDPTCVLFYNNSISPAGLELQRYPADTYASGLIPLVTDTATTLDDYYKANKASDGNYFAQSANDNDPTVIERRWYKVGNNFYTIDMPVLTDSYTSGFTESCVHESLSYYTQFAQMLTSIKAD
jgi:hypothetical protein